MSDSQELVEYLGRLQRLTTHVDPTLRTDASHAIKRAALSLGALEEITRESLTRWARKSPADVYTLGLVVGLSQEKLKNLLKAEFGTSSWAKAVRADAATVISWMDDSFNLIELLHSQLFVNYTFADVLIARGTSRTAATSAGAAGKLIEDAVEGIVQDLGLPYRMRGRFVGRNRETGPADLVVPDFENAKITVACKGFDSTGSKLTAAVTEVEMMAGVRYADQYVFAVVDGIGWNSRRGDFRRMFALRESGRIDGLYTLNDLPAFEAAIEAASRRIGLLS